MCDKRRFNSRRNANITIKVMKLHSKRDKVPQRAYWCIECDSYHLTSIKRERTEKRVKSKNNKWK